jgi:3-oxoacyl-[acyl-carrier-protein] synthase-3
MFLRSNWDAPGGRIVGLGTYLPEKTLTSEELEALIRHDGVAVTDGFIERVTGVQARRVAADTENASDLAEAAARHALEDAGLGVGDVDLLIFAAASHDVTEPATASILQAKLAAVRAQTFDVKNACNSFVSALDVANAYLRSGLARVVVVATGEIPSRAIQLRFGSQKDLMAKFAYLTMGDAGGAVVLMAATEVGQGILATGGVTRGEVWHLGTILSGGTMFPRDLSPQRAYLRNRGCELEECARREVPPVVEAVLDAARWAPETVDVVATQQHTRRIVREIVGMTGIPETRAAMPLRYAGNAAAANIPLCLAEAREQGKLESGSRVVLCGGSSGFSVSVSAVSW